jgi:hypothetical protein
MEGRDALDPGDDALGRIDQAWVAIDPVTPRYLGLAHKVAGPFVEPLHRVAIEGPAEQGEAMGFELLDLTRFELVYG